MSEQEFVKLLLENWAPAIFTVAVGGYLASVLFPQLLSRYQVSKQRAERRVELAEKVLVAFSRYIVALRRLVQIASLEAERALSEDEAARKRDFVVRRNERRDDLIDQLNLCRLHFSEGTSSLVSEFFAWDEAQTAKRLYELPPLERWREWEQKVVTSLRRDLNETL